MGSRSHLCLCVCVCVCVWVGVSDYRNELINPGVARLRLYISCANLVLYCQILGVCPRVPGLSVAPVTGSLIVFLTSSWIISAVSCPLHPCATETFQPSARLLWTHLCIFREFQINCLFSNRYWILSLHPCDRKDLTIDGFKRRLQHCKSFCL